MKSLMCRNPTLLFKEQYLNYFVVAIQSSPNLLFIKQCVTALTQERKFSDCPFDR